jgi:hypothetical protein
MVPRLMLLPFVFTAIGSQAAPASNAPRGFATVARIFVYYKSTMGD